MTTRRRIPLRFLLLVAVAVTALTGCSLDRVGAAAVVNGETISVEHLQAVTQEYLDAAPGQDHGRVQVLLLQDMILDRVFERFASTLDVSVSRGEVSAHVRALVEQAGGRDQLLAEINRGGQQVVPPSRLDEWARQRVLTERILAQVAQDSGEPSKVADNARRLFTRQLKRMDVEVNPRYGEWDPRGGIAALTSGGLATDVADLAKDGS